MVLCIEHLDESSVNVYAHLSLIPHDCRRFVIDLLVDQEQVPAYLSFCSIECISLGIGQIEPIVSCLLIVRLSDMNGRLWPGCSVDFGVAA